MSKVLPGKSTVEQMIKNKIISPEYARKTYGYGTTTTTTTTILPTTTVSRIIGPVVDPNPKSINIKIVDPVVTPSKKDVLFTNPTDRLGIGNIVVDKMPSADIFYKTKQGQEMAKTQLDFAYQAQQGLGIYPLKVTSLPDKAAEIINLDLARHGMIDIKGDPILVNRPPTDLPSGVDPGMPYYNLVYVPTERRIEESNKVESIFWKETAYKVGDIFKGFGEGLTKALYIGLAIVGGWILINLIKGSEQEA